MAAATLLLSLTSNSFSQTLTFSRIPADVIAFQGLPYTGYMIQTSTNLSDWQDLTLLKGNSSGSYSYTNFPYQDHLFYRTSAQATKVVTVSLDPATPLTRVQVISKVVQTANVLLGIFRVKSQGTPATLYSLNINVTTSGTDCTSLFANVKLQSGSLTYSAQSVVSNSPTSATIVFKNMTVGLAADTFAPISIVADVNPDSENVLDDTIASVTLITSNVANSNPEVVDGSFATLPVIASTNTANNVTFSAQSVFAVNLNASLGSMLPPDGMTTGYTVTFGFTLENVSDTDAFFSKDPTIGITMTNTSGLVLRLGLASANPAEYNGDTGTTCVIPAGLSRTFTYSGFVASTNGVAGFKTASITSIHYGTSPSDPGSATIGHGLQALTVNAAF